MGDDCRLLLQTDNYKRLRAEDTEKIKRLGLKIKNLKAAARHEIEVSGPIDAAMKDTIIVRDTVPLLRQKVEMITPHIRLTGLIEAERLKGEIRVPVTLQQTVWVEYKVVVLETGKGHPPDHCERQPLCEHSILGIYPNRVIFRNSLLPLFHKTLYKNRKDEKIDIR